MEDMRREEYAFEKCYNTLYHSMLQLSDTSVTFFPIFNQTDVTITLPLIVCVGYLQKVC